MSRKAFVHRSLTSQLAALALLTAGCSGTTNGAKAGGCRENSGWSAKERARWLRSGVSFPRATASERAEEAPAVVIRPRDAGDGGPLCDAIAVQIEFWRLTVTEAGTEMTSAMRFRLTTDGTKDRAIGFPPGLSDGERGACTVVVMAVYSGTSLTETELPEDIAHLALSTGGNVEFRGDRIAASKLIPLPEPEACGAYTEAWDLAPARPATPNPWGSNHP